MKILTVVLLVLLIIPGLVHARPTDISQEEWAEMKREDRKEAPVEVTVVAEPEIELDPDDYYCIGKTIQGKIFWVPEWCLERALPQIPLGPGESLFCKLGYMGGADEYAIVPSLPGEDKVAGWSYCVDLI